MLWEKWVGNEQKMWTLDVVIVYFVYIQLYIIVIFFGDYEIIFLFF